jgi:hypothetical protein
MSVTRRNAMLVMPLISLGILAAACGATHAGFQGSASQATRVVPPAQSPSLATIRRDIRSFAAANGDKSLRQATVYYTSRRNADIITEAADTYPAKDRHPVVVVFAEGHFVGYDASVPVGGRVPIGKFLEVVLDSSNHITDWGLVDTMPTFPSGMGSPTLLTLGPQTST